MLTDKQLKFKAEEVEEFLIIDEPKETLKHDIIDADIVGHMQKIMSNGKLCPSPKLKNMFAIVTGMGRGKTRTLVEIMRMINKENPSYLCVAITFTSDWTNIIGFEEIINGRELKKDMIYAINIVARVISMTYQMPFTSVQTLFFEGIRSLATIDATTPPDLIRSCIQFIVQQHRDNGHDIDNFVLLVDESVRISKILERGKQLDIHQILINSLFCFFNSRNVCFVLFYEIHYQRVFF
jgi:hypothetical protein